jgi:hypothetical protein
MVAFIVKEHKASWVTYLLSPIERARELNGYCYKHLSQPDKSSELYRIFYYDCYPMDKKLFHPYLRKQIDFAKTDLYT